MTTFILHGGQVKVDCENNNKFWAEFTNHVDKEIISICLIFWDRNPEEIDAISKFTQQKITEYSQERKVEFIVANNINDIKKNIDKIDVIYFSGGDFVYLEPFKKDLIELKNIISGKVYIGSSIGSFIVSRYFISSFEDQNQAIQEGFGLLPICNLCHWDKETKKSEKIARLQQVAPSLPILTLDETEFTQFIM